jgi:H+-translocating NAD(P) transhydrogenase subunit alpha
MRSNPSRVTCSGPDFVRCVPSTRYLVRSTWLALLAVILGCFLLSATNPLIAQSINPAAELPASNSTTHQPSESRPSLIISVTIFVLAILLGVELIGKVPATLHTPLMSGSNAISGITVVGALIAAGATGGWGPPLACLAVMLAMINVVGGFLVTHRMLQMFKRK